MMAANPKVKGIFPVSSEHVRLASIEEIEKKIEEVKKLFLSMDEGLKTFKETIAKGDIAANLESVIKKSAESDDLVLICGSFYIMSDVKAFF